MGRRECCWCKEQKESCKLYLSLGILGKVFNFGGEKALRLRGLMKPWHRNTDLVTLGRDEMTRHINSVGTVFERPLHIGIWSRDHVFFFLWISTFVPNFYTLHRVGAELMCRSRSMVIEREALVFRNYFCYDLISCLSCIPVGTQSAADGDPTAEHRGRAL